MGGYAVVDVETTGLFANGHHRIVEIAVVQLDPGGRVEASWATLLNPGRDLGPQHVHGIRAADVVRAPTFAQFAGEVAERIQGRTFVAHNVRFDVGFVRAAFAEAGWDVPLVPEASLCTMEWAGHLYPSAPRALQGCCEYLGIRLEHAHAALADATATAALLQNYVAAGAHSYWNEVLAYNEALPWPAIPPSGAVPVHRGADDGDQQHFLERLAARLPHTGETWEQEQYLALLDRALLDRVLSVRERDALVATAAEYGIDRPTAAWLHRGYLDALAGAAWADGVVTPDELADLQAVTELLGLGQVDLDEALESARHPAPAAADAGLAAVATPGGFVLARGDRVVFTGDMAVSREVWTARAAAAGLVPWPGVTKKVALVVAADPDSLSGKARKAADYGIPIVTEAAFERLLGGLRPQ